MVMVIVKPESSRVNTLEKNGYALCTSAQGGHLRSDEHIHLSNRFPTLNQITEIDIHSNLRNRTSQIREPPSTGRPYWCIAKLNVYSFN